MQCPMSNVIVRRRMSLLNQRFDESHFRTYINVLAYPMIRRLMSKQCVTACLFVNNWEVVIPERGSVTQDGQTISWKFIATSSMSQYENNTVASLYIYTSAMSVSISLLPYFICCPYESKLMIILPVKITHFVSQLSCPCLYCIKVLEGSDDLLTPA